jgi:hypothetical protein
MHSETISALSVSSDLVIHFDHLNSFSAIWKDKL